MHNNAEDNYYYRYSDEIGKVNQYTGNFFTFWPLIENDMNFQNLKAAGMRQNHIDSDV